MILDVFRYASWQTMAFTSPKKKRVLPLLWDRLVPRPTKEDTVPWRPIRHTRTAFAGTIVVRAHPHAFVHEATAVGMAPV